MTGESRLGDLDALRAAAMLLGVFWHANIFIAFIRPAYDLPHATGLSDDALDFFTDGLHAVRMPVFFVLAGFFAALVVNRSGEAAFVRQRLRRIGLPLVVAYFTLVPLAVALTFVMGDKPFGAGDVLFGGLGVVWFLWYLLLFYAIVLGLRRLPIATARAAAGRAFASVAASPARTLLLALPLLPVILPMKGLSVTTPVRWAPDPLALAYYGAFFAFGWLLFGRRELLPELRRHPAAHAVVAALLAVALFICSRRANPDGSGEWAIVHALTQTLLAWTALFASLGLAYRVFGTPRASVRYVADSAYWIYLAHPPLVVVIDAGLLRLDVPLVLAVPLTGLAAIAVLLLAYEHVVRYTPIGTALHGPRSRAIPATV